MQIWRLTAEAADASSNLKFAIPNCNLQLPRLAVLFPFVPQCLPYITCLNTIFAPREVVGGELHFHAIAGEDADEVLAHFAGNYAEDFRARRLSSLSLNIALGNAVHHGCFNFNRLRLCHRFPSIRRISFEPGSYGSSGK